MTLEVTAHMLLQSLLKFRQSIDTQDSDFHFWIMTSHHVAVGWLTNVSENLRDHYLQLKVEARQCAGQ
jgi:hypothetical protein